MEQFDMVPELKKKIESAFKDLVNNDRVLSSLSEKIQSGKGTYEDAHNFAGELAKCLQQAFQAHLSADQLPNGRFYYNMASRIIPDSLKTNHRMISEACVSVQESLNDSAGLHIQAQTAPVNQDRISGLVYRVSQDDFDKTKWLLDSPIENFCRSVVDDHAKANADFHYRSGLRPKIIRRTAGKCCKCCKWCSDLAGSYDYYPDMNRDVFRRHDNCRCTVVYDPANGSRRVQDVWDKQWKLEPREGEIAKLSTMRAANSRDPIYINSKNVKPLKGYDDVFIHGDEFGFVIKDSSGAEIEKVSVKDLADWIEKYGNFTENKIRLCACNAGAPGSITAQKLADFTGKNVLAPSGYLYIYPDGEMTIGIGNAGAYDNNGEWIEFEPKGKE